MLSAKNSAALAIAGAGIISALDSSQMAACNAP
jgi:hypothetical protein